MLYHRTTILGANTAIATVVVGTPVTPAIAANSLIVSNITADGDILIATQTVGNSQAAMWVDASAGTTSLYGAGVEALRVTATNVRALLTTVPHSTDGAALGTTTLMWADLFLASGGVINFNNGNVTITHTAGAIAGTGAWTHGNVAVDGTAVPSDGMYRPIGSGNLGFSVSTAAKLLLSSFAFSPATNDDITLGTGGLKWADLFLADGGVINFNNGNVTLTHSAGVLAMSAGVLGVGATSNANMTTGVTIDQTTSDNQILALRSSTDVVHGVTTIPLSIFDIGTNDYLAVGKASAIEGGAYIVTACETSLGRALTFESWSGAPPTTDTSASVGAMAFYVGQHDGANGALDMAADSDGFSWGEIDSLAARQTRMLLKADDGELHLGNTTLVALDAEDDVQVVRAMQREGSSAGIVASKYDNPFYSYSKLHELGLAGEKDKDGFFLFPLQSRLHAHEGAIWQMYTRFTERLDHLEAENRALRSLIPNPHGDLHETRSQERHLLLHAGE